MDTNVQKRRENKKSLRVKVISLGNAEVGKVRVDCRQSHIRNKTYFASFYSYALLLDTSMFYVKYNIIFTQIVIGQF